MQPILKRSADKARSYLARPVLSAMAQAPRSNDTAAQILLQLAYARLVREGTPLPRIKDVGFRVYSQSDEDGILLFLFSVIGATNKTCLEICAGDGMECNTANLILNHGWTALLFDGDAPNVAEGNKFYAASRDTFIYPPRFLQAWITRTNVNALVKDNGVEGEIDLLSLDMDGVDYWIWQALTVVAPRVVVLEYQDILGPERACTVPYADDFNAGKYPATSGMPNFAGASLAAFVKLGESKGYRLVGVNRYGYNAFFVRNGIADKILPRVDIKTCFDHPKNIQGMRERFPTVKDLPWVNV
jgi:hypothetical protein